MDSVKIGSQVVKLSNMEKVLFPEDGITKGDLIDYYRRASARMLPHIKDRPVMLHRFPNGISEEGFFQKAVSEYFPDWVGCAKVESAESGTIDHVVCSDEASLVYLANQASIAFHPWLSKLDNVNNPDQMVFDLDPQVDDFLVLRGAAASLRTLLEDELGLVAFVKSTGSRGLHVIVPLAPEQDFDTVREFARSAASLLADHYPEVFTTEIRKGGREAPVYVDVMRNSYGQTAVAPYSVRAIPGAPVAAPLDWSELDSMKSAQQFTLRNMRERLRGADPWKNMREQACSLVEATELMDALVTELARTQENVGSVGEVPE